MDRKYPKRNRKELRFTESDDEVTDVERDKIPNWWPIRLPDPKKQRDKRERDGKKAAREAVAKEDDEILRRTNNYMVKRGHDSEGIND